MADAPLPRQLTHKLQLMVAAGLLFVFATEALIRYFVELPALYRLEQMGDEKDIARVRTAWDEMTSNLARETQDYSQWDRTFEYMVSEPSLPEAVYFREYEIGVVTHQINHINGIVLVDGNMNVTYATHYDFNSGLPDPTPAVNFHALAPEFLLRLRQHRETNPAISGIIDSNVGVIMLAAQSIVNTDRTAPSRGLLIFWRAVDDSLIGEFTGLVRTELKLHSASNVPTIPELADKLRQLAASTAGFLPRDRDGHLYWVLEDILARPLFLVRQAAEARAFGTQLLSLSSLISICVAALLLFALTNFFSRVFVRRVESASVAMQEIQNTGSYQNHVKVDGDDELAQLASHFNAMLDRIQMQAEALNNSNEELARRSEHDPLTGIHNRGFFNDTLNLCWRQAARGRREISLLMVDVDYFKAFNDHYGHQRGDEVLKQIAGALEDTLQRATDYVARYGGEEFGVILTDTGVDSALGVAENLCKAVKKLGIRHEFSQCSNIVTISCGVATMVADPSDSDPTLINRADAALYAAKAAGRDCVRSAADPRQATS